MSVAGRILHQRRRASGLHAGPDSRPAHTTNMETFSRTDHTDDCLRHASTTSLPPVSHTSSQHQGGVVSIDELKIGGNKETLTPAEAGVSQNVCERHNLVHDTADLLKECLAVTNGHSRADIETGVACQHKISPPKGDDDEEAMDDVSDDDHVGYDDDQCGLPVNMDLVGDFQSMQPPLATLTQLAVPQVTEPATSLTRSSPAPRVLPTAHIENPAGQLEGHEHVTKQRVSCQLMPELSSRKMAAGTAPGPGLRSLPIHCVVELASPDVGDCRESMVVLDTYAILPGATPLSELVQTSLLRLGYSHGQTAGAKGGIQLKNWKTLMFEAVTDNLEATVEEILGEITSVATLRISLSSIKTSSEISSDPTKDRLLQLLLTKSIDFLVQAGCPVEKVY